MLKELDIQPLRTQKTKITTYVKRFLADTLTPVSAYLRLRDHFKGSALLESTDFRSVENCHSFIGLEPIAQTLLNDYNIIGNDVVTELQHFLSQFNINYQADYQGFNGVFGHTNFEAVQYFDTLKFDEAKRDIDIPLMHYCLYRYILCFNHFNDELFLLENAPEGEACTLDKIVTLMNAGRMGTYGFETVGEEETNLTDAEFRNLVKIGKHHCQIGDVFQLVFSRRFSQRFKGDDFNVYRILRSINPSPYLFYFDYGDYKIMGSSPEAQMIIENGTASVNPIAGTYRRTGDDEQDRRNAEKLLQDPKEVSEHIMLVDLARNDLSRHAKNVEVVKLKEVQFFSHVIHLVSKVQGKLAPDTNPIRVFGDTFPAGTLSGAPKYKAIELIEKYEKTARTFYGGAIGLIDFQGNMNQAITIRSFLSKDNVLHCQAGAGIVVSSDEESELQEVNHKLGALKKAIKAATSL
jgi:anthranilate synthase component I